MSWTECRVPADANPKSWTQLLDPLGDSNVGLCLLNERDQTYENTQSCHPF